MAYYDMWAEKIRDRGGRKRLLIIVTLILWAALIAASLIVAENSRRVSFDGTSLRLVSYSVTNWWTPPANIVLVDSAGNYMYVETTGGTQSLGSGFVAEYLGETFIHDPPSALLPSGFVEQINRIRVQGPVTYFSVALVIIFGLPTILFGVGAFIYPFEYWEFNRRHFDWHIKGGEPTDYGIYMQQFGGIFVVILAFALLFILR